MALSKIKLLSGDQVIGERTADFDGAFHIRFCSNKVKSDSVVIEGEGLGCLPTRISLKAVTDLALNIYLKLDTAFISSEHAKQEYLHNLYVDRRECGTDEFQRDYDADMQFRHCDGRVESFRRLFELNERMEEWERF